jgi:GNAT superfamily N-acetyltransferase
VAVTATVRDARPADNPGLVELAELCPMDGHVSLCVHRRPDFFALSSLAGEPWQVGIVDGERGPAGCVGVARRHVYVDGEPTQVAYVGDLKVHPAYRRRGIGRALGGWAVAAARDLVGGDGLLLGTVLAGNTAVEGLVGEFTGARRIATIRSYSVNLLWRRLLPRGGPEVREAAPDDEPELARLWRRHAASRQLAPVRPFRLGTPGLDYLVARRPGGEPVGFVGLWDQHGIKQLRVTGYSPRLAAARFAFNAIAPLARAPALPRPGGELRYRTVASVCAADPDTLRSLLRHACERLRGRCSLLTIGLDTRDPLTRALSGLLAQPTDVAVLVRGGRPSSLDGRPLHFEIATV